jgi:hypothetical protein
LGPAFVAFGGLFFELYPYILKAHKVFNSIPFLIIFNVLEVSIGGVQIFFKCQKKWSPPLGSGSL